MRRRRQSCFDARQRSSHYSGLILSVTPKLHYTNIVVQHVGSIVYNKLTTCWQHVRVVKFGCKLQLHYSQSKLVQLSRFYPEINIRHREGRGRCETRMAKARGLKCQEWTSSQQPPSQLKGLGSDVSYVSKSWKMIQLKSLYKNAK